MKADEETIILDGKSLTLEDVVAVARRNVQVSIAESAEEAVNRSRKIIDDIVTEKEWYMG